MTPHQLALSLEWLDAYRLAVGVRPLWPFASVLRDAATIEDGLRRVRLAPMDLAVADRFWRRWAPHYGWAVQ